jgi:hypothetical protein
VNIVPVVLFLNIFYSFCVLFYTVHIVISVLY